LSVYDPGGTALHPVDPLPALPQPVGHSMHVVLPARFWNNPVIQVLHLDEIIFPVSFEYLPGEQSLQPSLVATPFADEYFPAAQSLHEAEVL
jgi:hypothetical protein